jgi:hypothetical protein
VKRGAQRNLRSVSTALAVVCLSVTQPALADEPAATKPAATKPAATKPEHKSWTAPDPPLLDLPRIRLELWGLVGAFGTVKVKAGPERNAHLIEVHRDARLPRTPALGWRAVFDVRFHKDWLVGGQVGQLSLEGPRRQLHYRGISIQSRYLAPLPARTKIDTWLGEVFVRYVIRDNPRVRFMLGIGVTWTSLRLRVSTRVNRADARIQDVFGPSFGYYLAIEFFPPVIVFLESLTALVSPLRFPALASDIRAGFRLPLGGGFELGLAVAFTSVQIEDTKDLWGSGKPRLGHRHRRATWTSLGAEIGISWRF